MDPRVRQALRLLEEAGRLDLLAEDGARRERPVRQAASGVAAAVAACSPPRGRGCRSRRVPQVRGSGAGRGQTGTAGVPARRVALPKMRRPGPLGERPQAKAAYGGAGGGIGIDPPPAYRAGGAVSSEPRPFGARQMRGGLSARQMHRSDLRRWGGRKEEDVPAGRIPFFPGGGDRERAHDRGERAGRK
ncbi:hypothetical protein NDU88_006946 [Pleurodeles waltl]|uniref:Uncharacterized protein n=1 Tax=Pleurodeles waltl TaxID=8319 RepID=A0AAV7UR25_PLEWA|nr:hypothetical protein NDU88_006946 [Pleurodeles waltl]